MRWAQSRMAGRYSLLSHLLRRQPAVPLGLHHAPSCARVIGCQSYRSHRDGLATYPGDGALHTLVTKPKPTCPGEGWRALRVGQS